jgi:hypothetical protein
MSWRDVCSFCSVDLVKATIALGVPILRLKRRLCSTLPEGAASWCTPMGPNNR